MKEAPRQELSKRAPFWGSKLVMPQRQTQGSRQDSRAEMGTQTPKKNRGLNGR